MATASPWPSCDIDLGNGSDQKFDYSEGDPLSEFSDVELRCTDGRTLYLHSQVLALYSRFFKDLLRDVNYGARLLTSTDNKTFRRDANRWSLPVEETSSAWVNLLDCYIYEGNCRGVQPNSPPPILCQDNIQDIFHLSDKYDMPSIKMKCMAFLMSDEFELSCEPGTPGFLIRWLTWAEDHPGLDEFHRRCTVFLAAHIGTIACTVLAKLPELIVSDPDVSAMYQHPKGRSLLDTLNFLSNTMCVNTSSSSGVKTIATCLRYHGADTALNYATKWRQYPGM